MAGTYSELARGLLDSIGRSKLSKSDARPQIEAALDHIQNAHFLGQTSSQDLTALMAELRRLPQTKDLLGTFGGSATFKARFGEVEKQVREPVTGSPSSNDIAMKLARGNSAVADAVPQLMP
jgi:hypothetical protein